MRNAITLKGDGAAYALQKLARHQMLQMLLADIAQDMTVCKIEGWDVYEYIEMVRDELDGLPRKVVIKSETKGCEYPKSIVVCSNCWTQISRFVRDCPNCGEVISR